MYFIYRFKVYEYLLTHSKLMQNSTYSINHLLRLGDLSNKIMPLLCPANIFKQLLLLFHFFLWNIHNQPLIIFYICVYSVALKYSLSGKKIRKITVFFSFPL